MTTPTGAEGKFNLEDTVWVSPSKFIPKTGRSPLRENYPDGVTLTINELIKYNVAQSDGTACDILLELMGGTQRVQQDLEALGIKNMKIATTEMIQVANDTIQYQNWSTPKAMMDFFLAYHNDEYLTDASKAVLDEYLSVSTPWGDKRIKGLLPRETMVAHKTGSSGTYGELTRATNDSGIVILPNGDHMIVSVFLSDAHHSQEERNMIIANVAKSAYDYWTRLLIK
ncbi:MAG: serine hydrolase [Bacteroidota bacterium]